MASHSWYNMLNQEASVSGLAGFFGHLLRFIKKNLLILLVFLVLGGLLGGLVSLLKPIKYRAEIVFAALSCASTLTNATRSSRDMNDFFMNVRLKIKCSKVRAWGD